MFTGCWLKGHLCGRCPASPTPDFCGFENLLALWPPPVHPVARPVARAGPGVRAELSKLLAKLRSLHTNQGWASSPVSAHSKQALLPCLVLDFPRAGPFLTAASHWQVGWDTRTWLHLVSIGPGSPNTVPQAPREGDSCLPVCPRMLSKAQGLDQGHLRAGTHRSVSLGRGSLGTHLWGCRVWPHPTLRSLWEQCIHPQAQGSFQLRGGPPACSPPPSSP